jgi:hypothetical protein
MVRAFFNINFRYDRLTISIDIVYDISMATSLVIEFKCSNTSTLFRRTMVDHCRRNRRSHRDLPSPSQPQVMCAAIKHHSSSLHLPLPQKSVINGMTHPIPFR